MKRGDYNSPWKLALERYFEEFLSFFFPAVSAAVDWSRPVEFLDQELQRVTRSARVGRRTARAGKGPVAGRDAQAFCARIRAALGAHLAQHRSLCGPEFLEQVMAEIPSA